MPNNSKQISCDNRKNIFFTSILAIEPHALKNQYTIVPDEVSKC